MDANAMLSLGSLTMKAIDFVADNKRNTRIGVIDATLRFVDQAIDALEYINMQAQTGNVSAARGVADRARQNIESALSEAKPLSSSPIEVSLQRALAALTNIGLQGVGQMPFMSPMGPAFGTQPTNASWSAMAPQGQPIKETPGMPGLAARQMGAVVQAVRAELRAVRFLLSQMRAHSAGANGLGEPFTSKNFPWGSLIWLALTGANAAHGYRRTGTMGAVLWALPSLIAGKALGTTIGNGVGGAVFAVALSQGFGVPDPSRVPKAKQVKEE